MLDIDSNTQFINRDHCQKASEIVDVRYRFLPGQEQEYELVLWEVLSWYTVKSCIVHKVMQLLIFCHL